MDNEKHYIQHVTAMSAVNDVYSKEDIYADNGIKLLNKNVRITPELYDHLVQHKLLKPIDCSLSVEDAVTAHAIYKQAQHLIEVEPGLQMVINAMNDRELPSRVLNAINLVTPLAFKLTVARAQNLGMFKHSIRVALLSIYIGSKARLDRTALHELATAGLLHDIGVLHLNPKLLDPMYQYTDEDRDNMYAHPMLGYMVLEQFPEYHPTVSKAVLDHHERTDGSGYPRGLSDNKISKLGKILAVAELAVSFIDKHPCADNIGNLKIILKFNSDKYPAELTNYLIDLYNKNETHDSLSTTASIESLSREMNVIASILQSGKQLIKNNAQDSANHLQHNELFDLIEERISELEHSLARVGMLPNQFSDLARQIGDDHESLSELSALVSEMMFQMKALLYEVKRHEAASIDEGDAKSQVDKWLDASKQSLSEG